MAREVKKPQEQLAPAYFVQYSSLWCIMLGFFVMLLSLGNTQKGPGVEGVGEVRDAFGTKGGMGLFAFAKNVIFGRNDGNSGSFRIRQNTDGGGVEGDNNYVLGLLRKQGFSDLSNLVMVETEFGTKLVMKLPVEFQGNDQIGRESVRLIEQLAEVLVNLREYDFEVMSVCDTGEDWAARQRTALRQSAVVARLLADTTALPVGRIKAVGYSDPRFIDSYGMDPVKGHVLIAIQKK